VFHWYRLRSPKLAIGNGSSDCHSSDGRQRYLRRVLTRIADHSVDSIDELLPWNLTAEHYTDTSAPS